ncbi:hypothetical protein NDU88_002260 [Pleurodeles waltl]|uniref:Uncharacterized protein n=1 Tax=Pleurodeles waltl TaxID=8319 RepID=A0AAV7M1M9_PLEWA|nr:hypothetical protein NDU88_002260 [Pleurodeles waltl]
MWCTEGPGEPSGDGLPGPEALLASPGRTNEDVAAGLFKSPHRQGRQQQPEEEDESRSPDDEDIAQETDHCRLLNRGARNQEDARR